MAQPTRVRPRFGLHRAFVAFAAVGVLAVALTSSAVVVQARRTQAALGAEREDVRTAERALADLLVSFGEVDTALRLIDTLATADAAVVAIDLNSVAENATAFRELAVAYDVLAAQVGSEVIASVAPQLPELVHLLAEEHPARLGVELSENGGGLSALGATVAGVLPQVEAFRAETDRLAAHLAEEQSSLLRRTRHSAATTRKTALTAGAAASLLLVTLGAVLAARARRHERVLEAEQARRAAEARRNAFEMQVQSGLDMANDEPAAFRVVRAALEVAAPSVRAELLVADSSRSHMERVVATGTSVMAGCEVAMPEECPATRRGHRLEFADSQGIDVCPYLRDRGPCSAVCIPLSIAGATAGVLHAVAPTPDALDSDTVTLLQATGRIVADRIGMLRAFARSEAQAATDPLTGLLNRRAFEDRARQLVGQDGLFTVVFGDLDHFKHLNDVHGHDTGDRALRLFSRVLADEARPGDLVSRYGGEEFVVLMPRSGVDGALSLSTRVRTRLAEETVAAGLPPFTVSFGVAERVPGLDPRELVTRADMALLAAKHAGRNRTHVHLDDEIVPSADPSLPVEPEWARAMN